MNLSEKAPARRHHHVFNDSACVVFRIGLLLRTCLITRAGTMKRQKNHDFLTLSALLCSGRHNALVLQELEHAIIVALALEEHGSSVLVHLGIFHEQ